MPTLAPTMQPQNQAGLNRGNLQGESVESLQLSQAQIEERENDKKAMNNVWNAFLNPDAAQNVSFTRLDTPTTNAPAEVEYSSYPVHVAEAPTEEKPVTFAEVYARLQNETDSIASLQNDKIEDSTGTHEIKEAEPDHAPTIVSENATPKKMEGSIDFKATALGTSKEVLQNTIKVSKFGYKEGKDVFNAVKDLWTSFIGFREKKPDPKAKENAEKAAKRKANKQRFMGLLREGISLYYAAMRKALIELEVKLGVSSISPEERNRLLGRNRNMSFSGNDSVYAIHQTAFEMAEQKRRQMSAQSAPSSRGKPSAGQIFRDKNLQGERSAGNNMMSAVG